MRIAITGATGSIGTAVTRRLARDGHSLVGLARRVPRTTTPDREATSDITWTSVDLTRVTPAQLAGVFAGADAVVHLAWGFQPSHDLGYLTELGVGGTRRVVEAATAAAVPHLVHMSSVGAYSPREDDAAVDESWPTDGVPTSRYSRHKAAAERILDDLEASGSGPVMTRLRPGIVGQRSAGSALLRYGVPGWVPARAVGWLPVLPVDRGLTVPMVHADDVADAVARVIEQRAGGAFNLAAESPLTAADLAAGLGARLVHVPSGVLRPLVSAGWHLRLQQLDTGWLDLAFAIPLQDTARARDQLGWAPTRTATEVFAEVVDGMRDGAADRTVALRPRTVAGAMGDAWRKGLVSHRHQP